MNPYWSKATHLHHLILTQQLKVKIAENVKKKMLSPIRTQWK